MMMMILLESGDAAYLQQVVRTSPICEIPCGTDLGGVQ